MAKRRVSVRVPLVRWRASPPRPQANGTPRRRTRKATLTTIAAVISLTGLLALIFFIGWSVRILREYERAVIFRLGRSARAIESRRTGPRAWALAARPAYRPH